MKRFLFMLLIGLLPTPLFAEEAPQVVTLWPGPVPGETAALPPESDTPMKPGSRVTRRIANVSLPTLTILPAKSGTNTGVGIVIAPGGGYNILAWDLEGIEIGQWLSSIGVNAFVLKYRVPRRSTDQAGEAPLGARQDAQRAISYVRTHAKSYGIDPAKIGMLGFSAGGNLTALTLTHAEERSYKPVDSVDEASCRPDFGILIYPAYLIDPKKPEQLAANLPVNKDTPPCFLVHAYDDGLTPENSIRFFSALKKNKVPAELHIYSTGGHGFGMRKEGKPCATWPDRCREWMLAQKIIVEKK